jgi:hypothetical protein
MSDQLTAAERAWANSPLRAAEKASRDYYTARTQPQPWQPTTRGLNDTNTGGLTTEQIQDNMWAERLATAKSEDFASVKASVDHERAQRQATIAAIKARHQPQS